MPKQIKVEYIDIETLKEWPGNPRKNDDVVADVVKSIQAFGYTNPILVRRENNEIIAGHTRVKALRQIGEQQAPVIFLDLSETDAHVYNIFDNKSVENAEWNMSVLAENMLQFDELNVDLKLTGFDDDEIKCLVHGVDEFQPDPEGGQPRLDELEPKMVTCPQCGTEFDAKENECQ